MRTGTPVAGVTAGSGGKLEVKEVSTEEGIRSVSPVVLQLRTHLGEEELVAADIPAPFGTDSFHPVKARCLEIRR